MADKVTFETTVRGVTVTTTLYGALTPERLDRAQREARWRADQLAPVPVKRFEDSPVHRQDFEDEEPALNYVAQVGGHR